MSNCWRGAGWSRQGLLCPDWYTINQQAQSQSCAEADANVLVAMGRLGERQQQPLDLQQTFNKQFSSMEAVGQRQGALVPIRLSLVGQEGVRAIISEAVFHVCRLGATTRWPYVLPELLCAGDGRSGLRAWLFMLQHAVNSTVTCRNETEYPASCLCTADGLHAAGGKP